jgi:hypothetical protein
MMRAEGSFDAIDGAAIALPAGRSPGGLLGASARKKRCVASCRAPTIRNGARFAVSSWARSPSWLCRASASI